MNENKKKMRQTDKRKLRAIWNENRSSVGMKFFEKKFNKLLQKWLWLINDQILHQVGGGGWG